MNMEWSTVQSASILQKLISSLSKMLKRCGMELLDSIKESDGSVTHKMSCIVNLDGGDPEKVEFYVNGKPADANKDTVDLSFKYVDPYTDEEVVEKNRYTNVENKQDEIVKKCVDFIRDVFKTDTLEEIPENLEASTNSKSMKIQLQKVESREGCKLELRSINANYNPSEVLDDIHLILQDENLLQSVPSDSSEFYDVCVDDSGIDVELSTSDSDENFCDECLICTYDTILDCMYKAYLNIEMFKHTACGFNLDNIRSLSANILWNLNDQISMISDWVVEDNCELVNPIVRIQKFDPQCCYISNRTYWEEFCSSCSQLLSDLVYCMEVYSINLESSKQSCMQNWIRGWKYELNYSLSRSSY